MAHHLDYFELIGYVSLGLGAFRVLSQFVIKMIAIFAREEFSKRAFEVLRISPMERAASILRGRAGDGQLSGNTGLRDPDRSGPLATPRRGSSRSAG
jgi:hypothetical protein